MESDHPPVIQPTIQLTNIVDFNADKVGERGTPVESGFEFQSVTNPHFLTTEQILAINHLVGL